VTLLPLGLALGAGCNNGGQGVGDAAFASSSQSPLELTAAGGTCNVTIYCNGELAVDPYGTVVTGELASHVQSQCQDGYGCPYQPGEAYRGVLCNGKERDEAVDVQKVPCSKLESGLEP
jgi:hypothetical protein